MAKKSDPLDNLSPQGQVEVMRKMIFGTFGEVRGAEIWPQFEAGMLTKIRQLGDAPEPTKNFWKGAWRIYEID